jgi:hypothetical protein
MSCISSKYMCRHICFIGTMPRWSLLTSSP